MYKVKDKHVNNFINDNLTEVEKGMFDYLLLNFPEELMYVDLTEYTHKGETYTSDENIPLLILMIILAKTLGNSRELILGLDKMKDLKGLMNEIRELEDKAKEEGTNKYQSIINSKYKLIALMSLDLGRELDINLLENKEYQELLRKQFNIIQDTFSIYRNRGTPSAIHQTLRHFSYLDNNIENPISYVVETFDQSQEVFIDKELRKLYSTLHYEDATDDDPEKKGQIFVYLGELPSDYVNLDLPIDKPEIPQNTYYYLRKDNELYEELARTKAAGIYYILVAKAIAYHLYNQRPIIEEGSTMYSTEYSEFSIRLSDLEIKNMPQDKSFDLLQDDNKVFITIDYEDTMPPNDMDWYNIPLGFKIKKPGYVLQIVRGENYELAYTNRLDTMYVKFDREGGLRPTYKLEVYKNEELTGAPLFKDSFRASAQTTLRIRIIQENMAKFRPIVEISGYNEPFNINWRYSNNLLYGTPSVNIPHLREITAALSGNNNIETKGTVYQAGKLTDSIIINLNEIHITSKEEDITTTVYDIYDYNNSLSDNITIKDVVLNSSVINELKSAVSPLVITEIKNNRPEGIQIRITADMLNPTPVHLKVSGNITFKSSGIETAPAYILEQTTLHNSIGIAGNTLNIYEIRDILRSGPSIPLFPITITFTLNLDEYRIGGQWVELNENLFVREYIINS